MDADQWSEGQGQGADPAQAAVQYKVWVNHGSSPDPYKVVR